MVAYEGGKEMRLRNGRGLSSFIDAFKCIYVWCLKGKDTKQIW